MQFNVYGKIRGKDRPRFYNGHVYTTTQTREYEKQIQQEYKLLFGGVAPIEKSSNAYLEVKAYFKRPKKGKEEEYFCNKKPDVDNVLKIVMDALNGLAWKDDKQVVSANIEKMWTDKEEYLEVHIQEEL